LLCVSVPLWLVLMLLHLESLSRSFGSFTALSDITLSLPEVRIGLLGPNGAGKSTLLKILMGLLPPSAGSGRVLDQRLGGGRDAMLRLIKNLSIDHGKSVLLSTHLLADVEAVCERVVILAGGQVRSVGTVADLCSRRQHRLRLRVQGESLRFRDGLEASGVS